ncbi:MAG: hypothetical protein FWD69_02665 [Polyangiaceae bacterium]|nr:hypothetical protein [Polyangiaceae bacterium]
MNRKFVRDPMCDSHVASKPTAALAPYLGQPTCRFLVVLDHHGSGYEAHPRERLEQDIVDHLVRAGVDGKQVAVIAFEPELEIALLPAWERVVALLAKKRDELPSTTIAMDAQDPKSSLAAALKYYRLKSGAALFADLANELSLERLKTGVALGRISQHLVDWFGMR